MRQRQFSLFRQPTPKPTRPAGPRLVGFAQVQHAESRIPLARCSLTSFHEREVTRRPKGGAKGFGGGRRMAAFAEVSGAPAIPTPCLHWSPRTGQRLSFGRVSCAEHPPLA